MLLKRKLLYKSTIEYSISGRLFGRFYNIKENKLDLKN